MRDYTKFYTSKLIPDVEKAIPGVKIYLLKWIRGQDNSSMGVIYAFANEADRNKYWNNDGTATALGKTVGAKLNDLQKETEKYEVTSNDADRYNDWLVQ